MPNQSKLHSPASVGQRPHKKKRPWIMILIVIAVLSVSGLLAQRMLSPKTDASADGGTIAAQRGNLMVTVTQSGSIRAHKSIQYKCQVERRGAEVTILTIVENGTYITQEDVDNEKLLVKLDSSQLEDQLLQERMELSSDEEGVKSAKEAYGIQVLQNESSIATDKQDLRFRLLDLQMYLGADLANELIEDINDIVSVSEHVAPVIAQALADPNHIKGSQSAEDLKGWQDNIVTATGALNNAKANLIGTEKLYDANYVSVLDLERDRLDVKSKTFTAENAHVNLDLFKEYLFPKQAEEYLSLYIEAGRKLQRTYAECRAQLAQAQAKLNNAELTFNHQDERVTELIEQIDFCTIKAKAPGLVIYGSGDSGDMFRMMRGRMGSSGVIAEGESVYEGQTLISMPDTAAMIAEIGVHETEVDKVRAGQPAEIVMDAFPDKVLQGEVVEVAPLPDQQRGFLNPDLKVYKTLVKILGTHEFLKTRMSCRVQILVHRLDDVVRVPIQVVANRRGRKVCYVQTPDGPEERTVETGAFNDTFTEIIKGLEGGDEVLLNPPMFKEGVSETGSDEERFAGRDAPAPEQPAGPRPGSGQRPGGMRQGRPGARPGGRPGAGAGAVPRTGQGQRTPRQGQGGPSARAGGGAGAGQRELTDERIDQIIAMTKMRDPAKAEEYEKLRKEDLEALKKKIREDFAKMREAAGRQGGGRSGQGGGARGGRTEQGGPPGGGQGGRQGAGGTRRPQNN